MSLLSVACVWSLARHSPSALQGDRKLCSTKISSNQLCFEMHIQTILALFLVSSTVAAPVFCPQDALVDAKLRDERFVNDIVQCLVGQAPCKGQLAQNIRRLAPEVFKGHCPGCDACTRKQVAKSIYFMQENYPNKFHTLRTYYTG